MVGRGRRPRTARPHLSRAAGAQPGSTLVEAFQSLSERLSRDKPGRNPDLKSQRARYERGEGARGPVLDSRSQPAQIPAEKTFLGVFFFSFLLSI